jgi:hypothetical protein
MMIQSRVLALRGARCLLIVTALAVQCALQSASAADLLSVAATPESCAPVGGLSFVCGLNGPEDIALIPGTRWLVASGLAKGGGIRLVDTEAKVATLFYTGAPAQLHPNQTLYPDCVAPPDVQQFSAHGISLQPGRTPGLYTLYVVSHGDLEGIQVFAIDARGDAPVLTWLGCVPTGNLIGNSVTAYADGTILINVELRPGTTMADVYHRRVTGGVYRWTPATHALQLLPGTELSGNNGIEASEDGTEFYVATSGTQTVVVYARDRTAKPLRQVATPGFNPDNLRWTEHRLIAAGMMFDEPACGGTRESILEHGGDLQCHRGYVAAQLDPETLHWKILAYGEPNPAFGGIATAVVVGKTLWLSSYQADRVAFRPLPGSALE